MQRLAASEIQKQALWLFGVLMGVAIQEAITSFYNDFVSGNEPRDGLGVARLFTLLLVSLRFYFGSVQYFSAVYEPSVSIGEFRRRRFGTDLTFGLIQFAIVCCWGLSVALFDHRWPMFPALLLAILLCDVVWYVCAVSDTRKTIRIRVLVNAAAAVFGTIAFGATALCFMCFANGGRVELTQPQGAICELAAYVPVVIASAVELGRLVHGRAGVEEWLGEGLQRSEAHPG